MVTVLFSKRHHPGSYLIRAVTWSDWSHCELLHTDGNTLIGAAAPSGVEYDTLEHRLQIAASVVRVDFPGDFDKAWAFAVSQQGKPYDWGGVAGIGLHRDWQEADRWFCSELVGKALLEGGFMPYRADLLHRMTPQHLWVLDFPNTRLK